MGKIVGESEYRKVGRRHRGEPAYTPEHDPHQRQLGDETPRGGGGGGGVALGDTGISSEPVNLPPKLVGKLAEMLIPIVKQIATAIFPPIGPLLDIAYGLYMVYQNRETIAKVAQAVSDNDIEGLAVMAAKAVAKKGVEAIAEGAADKLVGASTDRLKAAGMFEGMPEVEEYYREYAKEEISSLVEEYGDKFVDEL